MTQARLRSAPRAARLAKRALTTARTARWRVSAGSRPGTRILTYHRIADDGDQLAVPPQAFREQMNLLTAWGTRVAGVTAALDDPAAPAVVLTFDDAYAEVVQVALPILAELGFGATLYVPTGVVDGSATFSWYTRQPPVASWDALAAAAQAGFEIGSHTVSHPVLPALSDVDAEHEIRASREQLERRLGVPVSSFCYPAGMFSERDKRIVGEAGYRSAVTCRQGAVTPASDPIELPRIPIERGDSLADFESKVAGGHDRPLPFTDVYRRRFKVGPPTSSR